MFDETIKNIEAEIARIDCALEPNTVSIYHGLRLEAKKDALFEIIENMSIYQQRYGKLQTQPQEIKLDPVKGVKAEIEVAYGATMQERTLAVNGVVFFKETVSNAGVANDMGELTPILDGIMMLTGDKKKNAPKVIEGDLVVKGTITCYGDVIVIPEEKQKRPRLTQLLRQLLKRRNSYSTRKTRLT